MGIGRAVSNAPSYGSFSFFFAFIINLEFFSLFNNTLKIRKDDILNRLCRP
jgi:hypothetical protein